MGLILSGFQSYWKVQTSPWGGCCCWNNLQCIWEQHGLSALLLPSHLMAPHSAYTQRSWRIKGSDPSPLVAKITSHTHYSASGPSNLPGIHLVLQAPMPKSPVPQILALLQNHSVILHHRGSTEISVAILSLAWEKVVQLNLEFVDVLGWWYMGLFLRDWGVCSTIVYLIQGEF